MYQIKRIERASELKYFWSLSSRLDYSAQECAYIKNFLSPAVNPLAANGPCAYLVAFKNGIPVQRLITGLDLRSAAARGKREGWLALFDGYRDPEASFLLLSYALKLQKEFGSTSLAGPLSPDGSGYLLGAQTEDGERGILTAPCGTWQREALESLGFLPIKHYMSANILLQADSVFASVYQKAEKRFKITVTPLKLSWFSDSAKKIGAFYLETLRADALRFVTHLKKFIDEDCSYIAGTGRHTIGYVLVFKDGKRQRRIATLMTDKSALAPQACVLLLGSVRKQLLKNGKTDAEVSLVDIDGGESLGLLKRFKAEKTNEFTVYNKQLT